MPYVPGAAHDVFVSYAHLDNEGPGGEPRGGWVDIFADRLAREVRRRLGTRDVDIWIDRQLAPNEPLTPEIVGAVRGSALLLVVMSPAYLRSVWCSREREEFLAVARDRVAEGRCFVVKQLDVPAADLPPELADLAGSEFFVEDRATGATRPLGDPDPAEPEFVSRMYALSQHLARKLKALGPEGGPVRTAGAPRVFLARATDDLEDCEEQLRNHLVQAGFEVPLRRLYVQGDAAGFEAAVRSDLDGCKVFVQVLSTARGLELPFGGAHRLPVLLAEVAERVRPSGLHVLRWRDRVIDAVAISSIADPAHRALVEGAIACPIEEFKRIVVEETRRNPDPPRPRSANVMVFVDAERRDRPIAQALGEVLARNGVACWWPLESGSPEAIRKDLEENLRDCDAVVVIYGASEPAWVREQLRFGMKVFSQRERRPSLALFQGPPPSKADLGVLAPDLELLDCTHGFQLEAVNEFVRRIRA